MSDALILEDETWVHLVWSFTGKLRSSAACFRLSLLLMTVAADGLEVIWSVGAVFEHWDNVVDLLGFMRAAWQA